MSEHKVVNLKSISQAKKTITYRQALQQVLDNLSETQGNTEVQTLIIAGEVGNGIIMQPVVGHDVMPVLGLLEVAKAYLIAQL